MTAEIRDYNNEVEELFLRFLMSKPDLFVRARNLIKAEYFANKDHRKVVDFIINHTDQFSSMPTPEQIAAITGKPLKLIEGINEHHEDWFLSEFETFCRHKGLEKAIVASMELLDDKRYGEVEKLVKDAVQISLIKDLGTDYYEDPKGRLLKMREKNNKVSTGWKNIDAKLYGGVEPGELTLFAGQPGAGKSLFLQNIALNWSQMGFNVIYFTLELSEQLSSLRMDAMLTGYSTREVMKNVDDVELKVKAIHKTNKGSLVIKYMPSGSTVNDFKAFIKEYEIESGLKTHAVVIDYLDLCMPSSVKVNVSDAFTKDKYVTEEIRNMGVELKLLMASASQLNRTSYEEIEFDPSHMAGGISKVNTCDNLLAIFCTNSMREQGRYQLQFLKTRSSAGVGSKVDMEFDIKSLRIIDAVESEDVTPGNKASSILNDIKNRKTISENKPELDPKEMLQDALRLKDLLKK